MSQPQLLEKIILFLENNHIEYMITGSIASSLQGEPRSTHDIDIVILIDQSTIKLLTDTFLPPQYYLSADAIEDAVQYKSMFNLIDTRESDKVHFWILTDEDFDMSRFKRKYTEDALGYNMKVSSPEDTILAKLRWAKLSGGSEKQYMDALRVYELQYVKLDKNYLEEWVKKLQVQDLFEKIKQQAKPVL